MTEERQRRFRLFTTNPQDSASIPPGETDGADGDVSDTLLTPDEADTAPVLTQEVILGGLASQSATAIDLRNLSKGCSATVKREVGTANMRSGPGLHFGKVATVSGGATFLVIGGANKDADGFRWFQVAVGDVAQGWVRGDMLNLSGKCAELPYVTDDDITPPPPPPPPADESGDDRFPKPSTHRVTQGYRESNHKGFDLATPVGTPLYAPQAGVVIRRLVCKACTDSKYNLYPCDGSVYSDPNWGYGYGNAITVRYDYAVCPSATRQEMDARGLSKGFVYVLLAHLSEVNVSLGQLFAAGDLLGKTGHTGCSSGPHLHFEVKIGKDESVDGRWLNQTPIPPEKFFKY